MPTQSYYCFDEMCRSGKPNPINKSDAKKVTLALLLTCSHVDVVSVEKWSLKHVLMNNIAPVHLPIDQACCSTACIASHNVVTFFFFWLMYLQACRQNTKVKWEE